MAGATTTTASAALQNIYNAEFAKTFYDDAPLMGSFRKIQSQGGKYYSWFVHSAGNTSTAEFDEGEGAANPGYVTKAGLSIAYKSFRTMVQVTGHLRDAVRGGYYDAVEDEMQGGKMALIHDIEETFASDLESAIDDGTSYAGVTRATYDLTSVVTAGGSAALTNAMLRETWEDLQLGNANHVQNIGELQLWSAQEQATAYSQIADASGGVYLSKQLGQGPLDTGRLQGGLAFNRAAWNVVPTLTNTNILFVAPSNVMIVEHRPVTVDLYAKNDDSDTYAITWAGCLVVKNPAKAAKIEALAA
jgi:hypothetical protein